MKITFLPKCLNAIHTPINLCIETKTLDLVSMKFSFRNKTKPEIEIIKRMS